MQQIERKCARSPKRKIIEANRSTRGFILLCALSMIIGVASGVAPVAAQETSSPLVRANPTWPSDKESRELLDELFYQRAIHSYFLTLRALNTLALRDGSEAAFGKGYNKVTTWYQRMGPKTWAPNPTPTSCTTCGTRI